MPAPQRHHFDVPWKSALTHFLPQFFAFFFPQYGALVDWSRGYRFLEQELPAAFGDGNIAPLRIADKVALVTLHGSAEPCALLHVEVQTRPDKAMAERMFDYFCRLRTLKSGGVASFVLLTGCTRANIQAEFISAISTSGVVFRCEIAALADFAVHCESLSNISNPIGLVTMAHLKTIDSSNVPEVRYKEKMRIARYLNSGKWSKEDAMHLFRIVDELMQLPAALERRFWRSVSAMEGANAMEWMCPVERMFFEDGEKVGKKEGKKEGRIEGRIEGKRLGEKAGWKKGLADGLKEGRSLGLERGIAEGRKIGAREILLHLLAIRFGEVPLSIKRKLSRADERQLAHWSEMLLTAGSLRAVFEGEAIK